MELLRDSYLRHGLAAALVAAGTSADAGATHVQEFSIDARGSIYIEVDDDWVDSSSRGGPIPTLRFATRIPGRMSVMITPLRTVDGRPAPSEEIRAFVEGAAEQARAQATEKTLEIVPMKGAETNGFRFRATDRSPKPGEYRFMQQGAVAAGTVFVTFTILYNEAGEKDALAAIAAIRNIRVAAKRI